ncbi:precorrin-6Y C5,15-methyltransferase (decarboxylating) subunit CbiT [Actinocrispum sp. NPDC049592]|uniref:precorrin-6Y C5,15-methyltransferase (decarboxylating) subunit CbiT n=1 Tax=Actinocrispum sp. NPDC049592 TaxID=3154835 RepID=UPI0034338F76
MTVTVVGVDGKTLPEGASNALTAADLVIGPQRLLDAHAPSDTPMLELERGLAEVTSAVNAVVLADGDPTFFGIIRTLREKSLRLVVLPAVSLLQRMFAALGRPSDDVSVVQGTDFNQAVNVCRARGAVAVLGANPAELAVALGGWRRTLVVAGPDGEVSTVDLVDAANRTWPEPWVVLCLAELDKLPPRGWIAGAQPLSGGWALPEDEFASRDGLVTTAEVRAVALARLAPAPGTLIWDVGAGSGAVAVECARLGAAVLAVERDPMQCLRIMANVSKFDVDVRVVEAELLAAISTLPKPDAIFIGGGGETAIRACHSVGAPRMVVAVSSIDSVAISMDAMRKADYKVAGTQVAAARLDEFADGTTRLAAVDPVTVLWGEK